MSLSRPQLQNPAVRFYQWSGSRGQLEWYDKDKQERVAVKLPFKFIVIDELHTITGYSDADQSGYWSNEVKDLRHDLTVRTKRGVKYVGPYKDSKGIRQVPADSKYAKSIYIAHKLDGEWQLGNIKASGVALTAWINLSGKHRTEGNIVALTGSTEGSKGATKFQIPTFEYGGAPDADTLQIATDMDRQLQDYLDVYLAAPKYDDNAEPIAEDSYEDTKATPEQIADFEKRKASNTQLNPDDFPDDLPPPPDEALNGEPFDLSDIPF